VIGVAAGFAVLNAIELPEAAAPVETSFLCLADVPAGSCGPDTAVAQFSATENRVALRYDQIPTVMVQAVVAAEDRDYFSHNGIDPTGILRALYQDVAASGGALQGGSTITQQYVKNRYLTSERTLKRKLREAALAVKVERKLSKQEILERYLNEVYFGRGAYGVEAASRAYFGVPARELRLDQAALLAGLIRAPELADPDRNPKEALRRRRTVLDAMVAVGSIDRRQAEDADKVPFEGNVIPRRSSTRNVRVEADFAAQGGEYIAEWVRQKLTATFGEGAAYTKGLRVYLTIDPTDQAAAAAAVNKVLGKPGDPGAALVSIDTNGRIIAMIGGQDYATSQVNYALGTAGGGSGRQPGSTFKPFALAAFVEQGNSVKSVYPAPKELVLRRANQGKDWPVRNYEEEDLGTVTVETATWKSVNTVYAQIMQQVGAKAVVDIAKRAGISAPLEPINSIVLGTSEVSVLDMATAYSTFMNHGTLVPPYVIQRVEGPRGNVLYEAPEPTRTQAFSPEVADTVTATLRGVITRGTGGQALSKTPAAGKTGTTQEFKDAWFAGYTCHITTVTWVGYPQPQSMENVRGVKVTGGSFPAAIWREYMAIATRGQEKCTYRSIDAGTRKINPDLVPGPPTTTTLPPSTTVPPPAQTTTTVPPTSAAPSPTTSPPPTAPPAVPVNAPG
jgi:penicillin-binding protein 1A